MSKTLLEQLSAMTVVVADTGDIAAIEKWKPRDTTTNPSLLQKAAAMPEYQDIVARSIEYGQRHATAGVSHAQLAGERLAIEFGLRILKIIPGRVSTEVDARLSHDTRGTIDKAHDIIRAYEQAGIKRDRILIKIASTWEGIRAAAELEKEKIHCNMTLLFGMHQAVAAAEAGAKLISPFVGRILDWHLQESGKTSIPAKQDPGVVSVTRIYNYYKAHGHKTEVMGASFRNIGEILELAGCDLLTIAPNLLEELQSKTAELERRLDPAKAAEQKPEKIAMDEGIFREMHEQDRMAKEKLAEGILNFGKAQHELEQAIQKRMLGG